MQQLLEHVTILTLSTPHEISGKFHIKARSNKEPYTFLKYLLTTMCLRTFIYIYVIFSVYLISHGYIIRTKNGKVRGLETKLSSNLTMYSYLGIPYARSPLGKLRFEPPVPSQQWSGIRDSTIQKSQCVQSRFATVRTNKIEGSEDCLYLNVYTSTLPDINNNINYPVMVWIHGGGFYEGDNGYELYPPENFVKQGIVVVTIAYRLGIFGFFHTGDLVSPGNNGIRDQIMALKWVNENIEKFGGDKNKVTISGESAGGMAVSHLILSPLSKGLFQKAIIQSGSSIMAPAIGEEQPIYAFTTGSLLGINANNSQELVTKLRNVDFRELEAASTRAGADTGQRLIAYTVVIEPKHQNAVISKSPYEMLENGEYNKVPILMGFNSNEGDGLPDMLLRSLLKESKLAPYNLVPIGLNLNASSDTNTINYVGTLIKEYYFPGSTTDYTDADFQHWFGDMVMTRALIQQGIFLSKHTVVYFYEFNCIGRLGNPLRTNWNAVGHAEELNYLFTRRTQPRILSDDDKICSQRVVKLWGNFIKFGNPTPNKDALLQGIIWPKTAPVPNMKYLHLDKNLSLRTNPNEKDYQFWNNIFNTYGKRPFKIY
ncbi:pyrethroid hydrolase Ces2a-like [Onthophagus taurus]|uniref:pyrethroid hydrolase Ces2a-like n=1 Tax=Onthophagus taurus TaxID=166361 RepID=UPI0039BEAEB4